MYYVFGIFGEDWYIFCSECYMYIFIIIVLESLQWEGFQLFFVCQICVCDLGCWGYIKYMLCLWWVREINGEYVFEIILFNFYDGIFSYQMLLGYFRFVCQNGCVCGQFLGEVCVLYWGNVVEKVIEGVYEVVGVFDWIEEKCDVMQLLILLLLVCQVLVQVVLIYCYGDEYQFVIIVDILIL